MAINQIEYIPSGGVCSRKIRVSVAGDKIESLEIEGGCHGNLQGIAALLKDMQVEEAIRRMEGIDCKGRGTSCPDQIALALKQMTAR